MAETAAWGPCASPAHVRSMAASTVDADLMVTVGDTDVVGEGLRRCCWEPGAALHHSDGRRAHSRGGAECAHRSAVVPGMPQRAREAVDGADAPIRVKTKIM